MCTLLHVACLYLSHFFKHSFGGSNNLRELLLCVRFDYNAIYSLIIAADCITYDFLSNLLCFVNILQ
jgi:predicted membrane channel-forming protein YqfA (hemolysin III family)